MLSSFLRLTLVVSVLSSLTPRSYQPTIVASANEVMSKKTRALVAPMRPGTSACLEASQHFYEAFLATCENPQALSPDDGKSMVLGYAVSVPKGIWSMSPASYSGRQRLMRIHSDAGSNAIEPGYRFHKTG